MTHEYDISITMFGKQFESFEDAKKAFDGFWDVEHFLQHSAKDFQVTLYKNTYQRMDGPDEELILREVISQKYLGK